MGARFGNPIKGLIGPYGGANDPQSGFVVTRPYADESMPQYGPHDGLDIGNGRSDDAVLALGDGAVYQAFRDDASGGALIVRIDHGNGWTSGYAHLGSIAVSVGQRVSEGQKIGTLDNTGWSTAAHLHFDTTYGNERRDPWPEILGDGSGEEDEGLWMATYADGNYERVQNKKYVTLEGANFRKGTTTDAPVLRKYDAGEAIIPHAQVKGPGVEAVDGRVWWFLTYKWTGAGYQEGALHISAIEYVGPIEEGDEDADKAAAAAAEEVAKAAADAAAEY